MRPEFIQCRRTEGQSYDRCCAINDHSSASASKGLENPNSARTDLEMNNPVTQLEGATQEDVRLNTDWDHSGSFRIVLLVA
jgi:hypothetical protein